MSDSDGDASDDDLAFTPVDDTSFGQRRWWDVANFVQQPTHPQWPRHPTDILVEWVKNDILHSFIYNVVYRYELNCAEFSLQNQYPPPAPGWSIELHQADMFVQILVEKIRLAQPSASIKFKNDLSPWTVIQPDPDIPPFPYLPIWDSKPFHWPEFGAADAFKHPVEPVVQGEST